MTVGLLSIGDELLRGEVANTNAQWLATQLSSLGFDIAAIHTVGDNRKALVMTLRSMFELHPLIIATGGLGPTTDDVTAEAAAEVAGAELVRNDNVLAAIRRRVAERDAELHPGHDKQALVPSGSEVLPNSGGTAPGLIVRADRTTAYLLPGVPHEMQQMFNDHVVPRVRGSVSNNSYALCLHTVGLGESAIADKLAGMEELHPSVSIGYRATSSEVDVRVEARAADYASSRELATAAADEIRSRLGTAVYGENDQTIAQLAGRSVRAKGWRLAVAESCTGGLIAQQLTSQPASDFFVGGTVAYANTAKTAVLGVSEDTLRGHGAVSAEVAAEMAEGARRSFNCDVAVSVTGIAGPSGASSEKPLGCCHFAVSYPGGTVVEQSVFSGSRSQVQQKAAHAALDLLRRTVISHARPSSSTDAR